MKKSLMWILTAVMSITFVALLYFQIMYLENMVRMREEQFSEGVMRALYATSEFLERQETMYFLEQDANIIESSVYETYSDPDAGNRQGIAGEINYAQPVQNVGSRYSTLQEVIRNQYLYQKGLLNEVILSILRDSGSRPASERADSTVIRNCLRTELANNGVNVPFTFALFGGGNRKIYSTPGFRADSGGKYSIHLFGNTNTPYTLSVEFPDKTDYIFRSVRFIIPTLVFTVILIVIFLYTVILAFRQKNLAEMKSDFINNMTHELKTPISTISLAGQMLSESSIRKNENTLQHLSEVIVDESKRLRFQVDKVLQLAVLDRTGSTLKFKECNANAIINSVVNTIKLKVEKHGGEINASLDAEDAEVYVDEMQFTNVIFNLLDNALKYMKEDEAPQLTVTTGNIGASKLEIKVCDNGIGIRKEDARHIFEKFYRVNTGNRHDVKGFGLGLAYVKKMVEAFGGQIRVESEIGVGSQFIIVLPLADGN